MVACQSLTPFEGGASFTDVDPKVKIVKRAMDIAIAGSGIVLTGPLLGAIAAAVKLTSKGPVFYTQRRAGAVQDVMGDAVTNVPTFAMFKFRSMVQDAEAKTGAVLASKADPRVTPIGRFLRRSRLDELPQFWNVLRGELSFVGPRPLADKEMRSNPEWRKMRLKVKPGITGMWQVCGRNDTTYEERVMLDLYYIHHWSPWLDLYLLARTIKTVLFTKGAY